MKCLNSDKISCLVNVYPPGNPLAIAKLVNTYFASSGAPRILVSDYRSLALFDDSLNAEAASLDSRVGVGFSWLDQGDNITYLANRIGMVILAAIIPGVYDTFFTAQH